MFICPGRRATYPHISIRTHRTHLLTLAPSDSHDTRDDMPGHRDGGTAARAGSSLGRYGEAPPTTLLAWLGRWQPRCRRSRRRQSSGDTVARMLVTRTLVVLSPVASVAAR